jgi:alpha-tubulin suppressor-like RCC1 family protein
MCVMRQWVLFAVALLPGCYRAPQSDSNCTITCSGGAETCPGDLACEGGFCVEPGQVCKPAFVDIAAGTGFACAIDVAGALWCWGSNLRHQISAADESSFPLATRIDTTRHWQALDAGGEHVCGIADGVLLCWGANDRGQVSDAVSGDVTTPLAITGGATTWTAVSAGVRSTCAIGEGRLYCWGANGNAQLGDGTQVDRGTPTLVQSAIEDWIDVAVGDRHACAISQASGVYCWGASPQGQAGPGAVNPQLTPNPVGTMASAIAVSANAACATSADGVLSCWGNNGFFELGESNASLPFSATPVVATAMKGWSAIAASQDTLCGVRSGQVVCWGSTTWGGLGNGFWRQGVSDRVFASVVGTMGATTISLGWNERIDVIAGSDARDLTLACALVGSDVMCWGDNRFGQLAMGAATMATTPTPIAGGHAFTDLQVGASHGCGVEAGVVSCWGSTELGAATGVLAGNSMKACNPNLDCDVAEPKSLNFFSPMATDVALGAVHSCAFHAGTITCWGDNSSGQLVGANPAPPRERDIPGPGGATWTSMLQTGRLGQCAMYRTGSVDATACWGNVLQQRTAVTSIGALDGVKGFALGSTTGGTNFDCVLDANNALLCQGDNAYGEYGNGTMTPTSTLMPVSPPRSYTAIATNWLSPTVCGVRSDQTVECWGQNDRGQTGATPFTPTLSPNVIAGLAQCSAVAVGRFHACALCSGSISCWGDNRFGQLGTGALDRDPQPARLVSGPPTQGTWVQLVAGYAFTCARSDAGLSQCWGFDPHAGLGNGGRSANLPVTVGARPAQ